MATKPHNYINPKVIDSRDKRGGGNNKHGRDIGKGISVSHLLTDDWKQDEE